MTRSTGETFLACIVAPLAWIAFAVTSVVLLPVDLALKLAGRRGFSYFSADRKITWTFDGARQSRRAREQTA